MDSSLTSFTTSSGRSKINSWVSMGVRHFHHPTESVVASAGLAAVENTHPQSEYTVCSWPVSLEAFSDHVKQLDEWAGSVKVPNTGLFTSSDVAAEPTHKVVPMSSFLADPQVQAAFRIQHRDNYGLDPARYQVTSTGADEITVKRLLSDNELRCPNCDTCPDCRNNTCPCKLQQYDLKERHIAHYFMAPLKVTLLVPKLKLPIHCTQANKPQVSLPACDDFQASFGRVSLTLVASCLYELNLNPVLNNENLARTYGVSADVLADIVAASFLCKAYYHHIDNDVTNIIADEFFSNYGKFISYAIDADRRVPLALIEGKNKENIRKLMEYIRDFLDITPKRLASDCNAAFRSVAEEVFGPELVWVQDFFHKVHSYILELKVPYARAQITRDKKVMKGAKNSKDYLFTEELERFLASCEEKDTSNASRIVANAQTLEFVERHGNIPPEVKRYILEYPVLSRLIAAMQLLSQAFRAPDEQTCRKYIGELKELAMYLFELSPEYFSKFKGFAKGLEVRENSIIAYVKSGLTSSIIEGMNCKIKLIKRSLRGFVDPVIFMFRCQFAFIPKTPQKRYGEDMLVS